MTNELLKKVDEDTAAFNAIMAAMQLQKGSESRKFALNEATKQAINVPLATMRLAVESFDIIKKMALEGNPNSVSDAGVGALCARAAVRGAFLNVKINTQGFSDTDFVEKALAEAHDLLKIAETEEHLILEIVEAKIK